jgi:hypothetical protein
MNPVFCSNTFGFELGRIIIGNMVAIIGNMVAIIEPHKGWVWIGWY